jgi:hypothetical protein
MALFEDIAFPIKKPIRYVRRVGQNGVFACLNVTFNVYEIDIRTSNDWESASLEQILHSAKAYSSPENVGIEQFEDQRLIAFAFDKVVPVRFFPYLPSIWNVPQAFSAGRITPHLPPKHGTVHDFCPPKIA